MSSRMRNLIIIIIALLVVLGVGYLSYTTQSRSTAVDDQAAVRSAVTNLGGYLKSIPLTEPTEDLRRDIQQNYAPFVTEALLQQWRANPTQAPGRAASSPWPDHVEISQVNKQGDGYAVLGTIVMYSSASLSRGGDEGKVPFVAQLVKEGDTWKIAVFQTSHQTAPSVQPLAPAAATAHPTR